MEQILRGKEMAEIKNAKIKDDEISKFQIDDNFNISEIMTQIFDYSRQVVYFPIRHHSPACSYHLEKVIEEYEPECILIEGPSGANEMLDVMTHKDTQAPFAVYYSYKDSKGYVSDDKEEYKCYYPFLDYSPELVAVREGVKRGITTEFFDLPYAEILIASNEDKGLRTNEEKNNYNDDYYLARSYFMEKLVEDSGLRCFDEFWEKFFEIDGLTQGTSDFVKNVMYYCVLSRLTTSAHELTEDGCLVREAYMCENIEKAREKYKKILVVTGGFHTYGLIQLQEKSKKEKVKLHSIPKECKGVYLMSYSMEAADNLNGYASGMPYPAFYQYIWDGIKKADTKDDNIYSEIYGNTVLKYLVDTGKEIRKKEGYLSTYDEICAFSMTDNLAALRGKKFAGVYELMDSVLSSYIKGEYNLSTDSPMRVLRKKLTGNKIGSLCESAKLPPLVQCFEQRCKSYRLKIQNTSKTEITLSVFSTPKHRQISEFFYQLEFLETGFVTKLKGPNLRLKKDRNLIREIWEYRWSSQVIAALIDASVYGATLQEACISIAKKRLKKDLNAAAVSTLLIQMFEMGLNEQLETAFLRLEELIQKDNDFFSLVEVLKNVVMLSELSNMYQSQMKLDGILHSVYTKVMYTLPFMGQIKEEALNDTMEALKTLYAIMNRTEYSEDKDDFIDILFKLLKKNDLNAGLEGCIRGILYGFSKMTASQIASVCTGYMAGTREKKLSVASVLRGLFFAAKDLLFTGDTFVKLIDEFVDSIDDEEFMKLLPQLRIAFSYFIPLEIDEIAQKVTDIYGISTVTFATMENVSPEFYSYGEKLEKEILKRE